MNKLKHFYQNTYIIQLLSGTFLNPSGRVNKYAGGSLPILWCTTFILPVKWHQWKLYWAGKKLTGVFICYTMPWFNYDLLYKIINGWFQKVDQSKDKQNK